MPSPTRCRSLIATGCAGSSISRGSHPTPRRGAGARLCCRVACCGLTRPRSPAPVSRCRPAHHTSRTGGYRVCLTKRNPCSLDPDRPQRPRGLAGLYRVSQVLDASSRVLQRQRRCSASGSGHRTGRHRWSTGSSSSSRRSSPRCRRWRARCGPGCAGLGDESIANWSASLRSGKPILGRRWEWHPIQADYSASAARSVPLRASVDSRVGAARSPLR